MKRKGKRLGTGTGKGRDGSGPKRRGYGWFKEWVSRRNPELSGVEDEAGREMASLDVKRQVAWFRRLFQEGERAEREKVLQLFALLHPGESGPFFRDVMTSERTRLREKKRARDELRKIEPEAEPEAGEAALEAAWQFVENAFEGENYLAVTVDAGSFTRALEPFASLTETLQGGVIGELLERDPARAIPFLRSVLETLEPLWDAVLEGLEEEPHEEAARLIQWGYERTEDKALRKKMKKVNHKRRARGVSSFGLESTDTGRVIWSPPEPARPVGILSMGETPDSRMVWVIRNNVPRGRLIYTGWLHDRQGILKFMLMDMSGREAEKYQETVLQSGELNAVETDPAYCAYLLEEAYGRGAPRDPEEAKAYRGFRTLLKELLLQRDPRHPLHGAFADEDAEPGGEDPEDPRGREAAPLDHPLLKNWRLERPQMLAHLEKLEEIDGSRIIVNPMQKRERVEEFYRGAAREIFAVPEDRQRMKARLEDTAWVLVQKGERDTAGPLARAGRHLEDPGRDASDDPFLVSLVQKSMEELLRSKKTTEKETPSLIVKPS